MAKKSVLLEYLMTRTKEKSTADQKKASANYFFVSLLELLSKKKEGDLPAELAADDAANELDEIVSLLEKYKLDTTSAVSRIAAAVGSGEYRSSIDEFLFAKIAYNAEAKAKQMGRDTVDAYVYVKIILDEPTDILRPLLNAPDEKDAEPTAQADFQTFLSTLFDSEQSEKSDESENDGGAKEAEEANAVTPEEAERLAAEQAEAKKKEGTSKLARTVKDVRDVQKTLLNHVFGQDHAVNTFVSGFFQARLMEQTKNGGKRPQATFLFAGPPGVGKTFLAEKSAEALGLPFMRFDMSEYCEDDSCVEFAGSDNVYKHGKEGNVTGFVAKNPRCVLLFDEVEKAHISIIHFFLQMLDAGQVRDNFTDEEVSFSKAILIFTTNAGKNLYNDPAISNLSALSRKQILRALSTDMTPDGNRPLFPEAICSRFASGNIVMFNRLGAGDLYTIVNREIAADVSGLEKSTGIEINVDDKVTTAIILTEGGNADARTVKGRANAFFHEELYELFRLLASGSDTLDGLKRIRVNVALDDGNNEVNALFVSPSAYEVLLFADPARGEAIRRAMPGVVCHVTNDVGEAKNILFDHDIAIIVSDIYSGVRGKGHAFLNAEDIVSLGRDFMQYALARESEPVYILQSEEGAVSQEEFLSFSRLGVRDILPLCGDDPVAFERYVTEQCHVAYQQRNMRKLSRENKVLSYKTLQTVSADRESAEIILYDLRLTTAVDAEDSDSILDHVSRPDILFEDVIGAEDAKRELTYFVEYLKDPVKYMRKGVSAPKGVLLYGPPGTGKTMLAKAMAGESSVTFMTAEGNQFLRKYIGEGSEEVHRIFAAARKYAPTILFIDEIDAIAKNRDSDDTSAGNANTLTAFLTEMDGFRTDTTKPVFVLAATNFDVTPGGKRSLDPALLRRFDRRIYIDLPTKEERKRFLRKRAEERKMVSLSEEELESIAVRSTGMSLAELESVFEMAVRGAIRDADNAVNDAAFEEAFETFTGGEQKKWNDDTLERVARHESGHALLCWLSGEKPSYVTVVARGDHGGYMRHGDSEDKGIYTRAELIARIRTSLAGRAAEVVYYGEEGGVSSGASGDLHSASMLAERMICNYGMDEEFGLLYLNDSELHSNYFNEIRKRANGILAQEFAQTVATVRKNKAAIDRLSEALIRNNHLKGNEIDAIFSETVVV